MTGGPTPLADLNSAVKKFSIKKVDETLSCKPSHEQDLQFKFKECAEAHSVSKYEATNKEFWKESSRKVSYPTDANKLVSDKQQNILKPALRAPSNNPIFQTAPSEYGSNKKVAFSSYRNIRLFKTEQSEDAETSK